MYIGRTREQLSEHFSKHCNDIQNRSENTQFAKRFHQSRNVNDDLNATILQNNIRTSAAGRYPEDKLMCRLKTLAQYTLNTETDDYTKEIYNFY